MHRNQFIAEILMAQDNAARLLEMQRNHAATEARIRARVDAEIARRAEEDRLASDRCPVTGDEYGSLS
jgi:hypothetical protein